MSANNIVQYIKEYKKLNEKTLNEINQLIEKYPYFHALYLLWIKNLQNLNIDINKYLPVIALRVVDRKILYGYLNNDIKKEEYNEQINEKITYNEDIHTAENNQDIKSKILVNTDKTEIINDEKNTDQNNIEIVIDKENAYKKKLSKSLKNNISNTLSSQLDDIKNGTNESLLFVVENTIKDGGYKLNKQDYKSEESLTSNDVVIGKEKPDIEKIKNYKDYLIERFIEKGQEKIVIKPEEMTEQKDISEDSVKEHEDFFTETLAKIFIKQGNYSKAIYAYEKLILKYPEKIDYFAKKIEEIKKLLNNSNE